MSKPDFIIAGTQRGGTTSLYNYLSQHPMVIPANRKELYFFNKYFYRGTEWYEDRFPDKGTDEQTGEATPYYMFSPRFAKRLRATYPTMKLIILLRNPVDRAYSHYKLEVSRGNEGLSFEDALYVEEDRLRGKEEMLERGDMAFIKEHFCSSYKAKGNYARQITRILEYIPMNQIMFIKSEALFEEPAKVYSKVLKFLRLPVYLNIDFKVYNPGTGKLTDGRLRAQLNEYFKPYNEDLYDLLKFDFQWEEHEGV